MPLGPIYLTLMMMCYLHHHHCLLRLLRSRRHRLHHLHHHHVIECTSFLHTRSLIIEDVLWIHMSSARLITHFSSPSPTSPFRSDTAQVSLSTGEHARSLFPLSASSLGVAIACSWAGGSGDSAVSRTASAFFSLQSSSPSLNETSLPNTFTYVFNIRGGKSMK